MLVEVILTAKIEAGAIESINFVRGLMENLTAERQFFGDLSLEQPPVLSKYWSEASISSIENLIALITVPVPHRRPG